MSLHLEYLLKMIMSLSHDSRKQCFDLKVVLFLFCFDSCLTSR